MNDTYKLTNGRVVTVGKRLDPTPGKPHYRHLTMGGSIPVPPVSIDYSSAAKVSLSNIDLNGVLGDCVIAEDEHYLGLATANSGNDEYIPDNAKIIQDYTEFCDFDINNSDNTDNGCSIERVLNGRMTKGYPNGTKLLSWIPLDCTNVMAVKQCIWLFMFAKAGLNLPQEYLDGLDTLTTGFVWDVAGPGIVSKGHCIFSAVGYNPKGVIIDTWGILGTMTWPALAKYLNPDVKGELYTGLSANILNPKTGLTPANKRWRDTVLYFNEMGGNVPVPEDTIISETSNKLVSRINVDGIWYESVEMKKL